LSDRADLLRDGAEQNVVIWLVHLSIDLDAPASRTSSNFLKVAFFWRNSQRRSWGQESADIGN
jgi:hypothetical protein